MLREQLSRTVFQWKFISKNKQHAIACHLLENSLSNTDVKGRTVQTKQSVVFALFNADFSLGFLLARLDVTKQKDLSGFYRHLLNQAVGEEEVPECSFREAR